MSSERIKLQDTLSEVIFKMSDGNPGALTAIMALFESNVRVDPDDWMGPLGSIMSLDGYGIYGTDIYILWSDICDKNIVHMIAVLRAAQLGYVSSEVIKDAVSRQDYSGRELLDIDDLYKKVKERLPDFDS